MSFFLEHVVEESGGQYIKISGFVGF